MGFPVAKLTGAITAVSGVFVLPVNQASFALVQMVAASLVGHNCAIEGSIDSTTGVDGTWFAVSASRSNALGTVESATGTLTATPAYLWRIPCAGLKYIRFRATAHTSGTATYTGVSMDDGVEGLVSAVMQSSVSITGTVTTSPTSPTQSFINSAATTNATSVKNSAGTVYGLVISNTNAAARYVKLYNKSSAPTVGTDVPVLTIVVPGGSVVSVMCGDLGLRFGTGIALAITAAAGDTDTTAVAAGEIKVATSYV